jgi:predicted KAP-like P-loop ATPase
MILPDYPIEDKDGDKLRRAPLAKKVAELVASFEGKESFVIGIEGVWGSGKTSFINLVLKDLEKDQKLIFVKFNPWNFTGQNELITDFFSSVLNKIEPFVSDKSKLKRVKSIVSKLTKKSEVAFSPELSFVGGLVNFKANDLLKFGGTEKTLEEERADIDHLFKGLGKKVVIIIDDIDRLDMEETRLVMKLVKMTANFPNTVFLLAYDRKQVADKLGEKENIGEEYLKKIIQVSFTLPKPDEQGLQRILIADLEKTIADVYGKVKLEGNDEKRWSDMAYKGFFKPFGTIRDIKRYISSLRLNWSIVNGEDVNMVDFMAIELIRVFALSLYSGIAANASLFTGYHGLSEYGENSKKNLKAKFKELIDALPKELQKPIGSIGEILFPQLENTNYSGEWLQTWQKERRICVAERFGFYFQLGIPEGAISEVEAEALAKEFGEPKAFSEKILELAKDNRLRPMLVKILDRVDKLSEEQAKVIISTLWELGDDVIGERTEAFDFDDVETQISRIAYHAIKHLPKEKHYEVLEYLLNNTKAFYHATRFVAMLIDQTKKQGSEPPLLTAEEAQKLGGIVLKKVKDLADAGKLQKEKGLVFALYRWKEWEGAEMVKEYIKKLVSTRDGLLAFLKGFVGRVLSTAGNYDRLDKKGIEPLYPIAEIEELVKGISDNELAKMDEKDKQAINLFRNPPKQDW